MVILGQLGIAKPVFILLLGSSTGRVHQASAANLDSGNNGSGIGSIIWVAQEKRETSGGPTGGEMKRETCGVGR